MLLTEYTAARLEHPERFALREIDRVIPKGKTQAVRVCEVLDALPVAARERRKRSLSDFERGLAAFREGDLEAALQEFSKCVAVDQDDAPAKLYLKRCRVSAALD